MSNGIYGAQLLSFPEQFRNFPYFDMKALQGGGYGPRLEASTVRGVFQCTGGRRVKTQNGMKVLGRQTRLWTTQELQTGRFIEAEHDVYTVGMPDNEWQLEGGFTVYDLEKVVGDDGRDTVDPDFNMGEKDFA